jgi:RNA polymerase sigma-70 factor (ECF subfamily)
VAINEQTFLDYLDQYKDEFYRYVYRNVWNESVVEDVFSSAIMVAWEKRNKFREGSNFRAWVYKILSNKIFVANREIKRSSIDIDTISESQFATDPVGEEIALDNPELFFEQLGDELNSALRQVSTAERSCLLLLSIEKYSYKEISEILEMPVGTVMTHLSRGRTKLRRLLVSHAMIEGILTEDSKYIKKLEKERRSENAG